MRLGRDVYDAVHAFPRAALFGLSAQIRRAAVSVPANIAEGNGRRSLGDYLRFLSIANGSLTERRTLLLFAHGLGHLGDADLRRLDEGIDRTGRLLGGLIRSLEAVRARHGGAQ